MRLKEQDKDIKNQRLKHDNSNRAKKRISSEFRVIASLGHNDFDFYSPNPEFRVVFILQKINSLEMGLWDSLLNWLRREFMEQSIIPGLPDDLALRCIGKLSHGYHGVLECVSRGWRDLVRSVDYSCYKARNGWSGSWLFVLTERSKNQWVAYDPEADRWHPLPRTRAVQDG